MENIEVLDILKSADSLLDGHFLLTSGNHSNRYCQCAKLLQYPDKAQQVVAKIVENLAAANIEADLVVGPAMGGIVVGYELARQLNVRSIFTERENEVMTLRRGFTISPGERVIIAEDVVTTGKSTLETAKVIESYGGKVVALTAIVDRRNKEADIPFPIVAATSLSVDTYPADNCPLCKEGIPIVKPGSRKIV